MNADDCGREVFIHLHLQLSRGRDGVSPGYRGSLQVIAVTSRGLRQGLLAQEVLAGGSASSILKLKGRKVVPKPD